MEPMLSSTHPRVCSYCSGLCAMQSAAQTFITNLDFAVQLSVLKSANRHEALRKGVQNYIAPVLSGRILKTIESISHGCQVDSYMRKGHQ